MINHAVATVGFALLLTTAIVLSPIVGGVGVAANTNPLIFAHGLFPWTLDIVCTSD